MEKKCLGSFIIIKGMGVKILKEMGCTKCTICSISLVIKWTKFWSEKIYKLWMMRLFNSYDFLKNILYKI